MSELRKTLLSFDTTKIIPYVLWGTDVFIKTMSAKERVAFSSWAETSKDAIVNFAKLVVTCVVDAEKQLIFSEEDIPAIIEKDLDSLINLANAIISHNGMDVESAKKN